MNFFERKTLSNSDETLLVLYAQTNSSDYFGELYNRYIPLIYGLCLKYLQNAKKAEDVTLKLFEILLPEVSNYEIKNFKNWIYGVAKNHCLQLLKKEKQHILPDSDVTTKGFDYVLHLLEEPYSEDEKEALNSCIIKLPIQQKKSMSMFYKEKMSYADIVEETGYLLKTVKNHIQNGTKNLKNCIEKYPSE